MSLDDRDGNYADFFHPPQKDETVLEGCKCANSGHLCGIVLGGFAVAPVVKREIVGASGGVEKGDFADDVGEASDEKRERAGCEWVVIRVVEWDF